MNITIIGGGISGLTCIKTLINKTMLKERINADFMSAFKNKETEKKNFLGISDIAISQFLYTLDNSYREMIKNKTVKIKYDKIKMYDLPLILYDIIMIIIYEKLNILNEYNIKIINIKNINDKINEMINIINECV